MKFTVARQTLASKWTSYLECHYVDSYEFFYWHFRDLTFFLSKTSLWFERQTLNDDLAEFHLIYICTGGFSERAKESENVGKRANY